MALPPGVIRRFFSGPGTPDEISPDVVRTGLLEPRAGRKRRERRGALWVRIETAECTLQLINTHLSLNRVERHLQVRELTGPR